MSFLGDSLSLVALMLHVAETTGQALAVAWLLLAGDFAPALLGLADRDGGRPARPPPVMIGCELLQGALVVVIALWLPALPLLLVLVGLRAVAGQVFQPASRAAVLSVVPERDLERANAAVGVATNGGETLGPLVAALLLPVLEVRGVLLVDAASFLVSAALLLPPLAGAGGGDRARPASFLADAGAGLRYLRGQPVLRAVVGGYVAVVACTGIDDVALVFLATDTFGRRVRGRAAAGRRRHRLLAGYAPCSTGGRALIDRDHPGGPPTLRRARCCWPASPSAAPATCSLAGRAVAAAFAVQAVRGLGIAAMDVAATTLVQGRACLRGRVFGSLYGGIGVAAAWSYLRAGCCWTGPRPGRLRGRRGRRPAGHRRHRPGPAAGRELSRSGLFPRPRTKRTFNAVGAPAAEVGHEHPSCAHGRRGGAGGDDAPGTALAPAGRRGAVAATSGPARPVSATTTSRCTGTAATTSSTTC